VWKYGVARFVLARVFRKLPAGYALDAIDWFETGRPGGGQGKFEGERRAGGDRDGNPGWKLYNCGPQSGPPKEGARKGSTANKHERTPR